MALFKKVALSLVVVTSCGSALADWLDDVSHLVSQKKQFIIADALAIVTTYEQTASSEVVRLEKALKQQQSGFWGMLHTGGYKVELATAKNDKKYYQKIAQVVTQLPDNKNQREKFIQSLIDLNRIEQDLYAFKTAFKAQKDRAEQFKLGVKITAKKAELSAKKAYIKSALLLS